MRLAAATLLTLGTLLASCAGKPDVREYTITGQVLAIRAERREIVIRHDDIDGFMPGMTMPFRVREPRWLEGTTPGDVVRARLVLEGTEAYLTDIRPTGRREPLPESTEAPTVMEPPLEPGEPIPDLALIDQLGRPFTLHQLRGRPVALTFTYTRCPMPTYCPAQDSRFRELQQQVTARPELAGARLVSITIDPEHDRPDVLRAHAAALGTVPAIWRFATGDRDEILAFGASLALTVMRDDPASVDLLHSLRTAVVDAEGRLVRRYDGSGWQVSDVVRDLASAR